jgi:quinol-cytochrome oxidoreductase complex cytochrome b subunit
LILLIAVCFTGYTLAACQMSYWAAAVIFRMLSVIPVVGDRLADYILAGPTPWSMTIRRIFTVHVILPFVTLAVIFAHLLELHTAGSVGDFVTRLDVPRSDELDFHRLVWSRDVLALLLYLWFAYLLVFVYPEWLLHPDTWVPANPLVTPLSIQPEWYFMLLYSILRAIPHKGLGMLTLVLFIWSFYALYNLQRTNEHRSRYISNRTTLLLTIVDFLVISYLCTHLHHYDTYFALMLYLAVATHLLFVNYHLSIYIPTVTTAVPLRTNTAVYHDLTLHIQSQEGPKLPSYWLYAVLVWFIIVSHFMLSLATRDAHLNLFVPVLFLILTILAVISANYDDLTW